MELLTIGEKETLLSIIRACHSGIITDERCEEIMNQLKELIPFDFWGIVMTYFDAENLHIDELSWFRGIDGFEEYYRENKLFFRDPISLVALEQMKNGEPQVQYWADTYSQNPVEDFFNEISKFEIVNYNGYTVLHKINLLQSIGFSITGPRLGPKEQRIVNILEDIVPHIAHVAQNGKIGKLKDLTSKQFNVYQLLKAGLTHEQAGKVLNISMSGVVKHFEAIKKKTGLNSRKEISYGFKKL